MWMLKSIGFSVLLDRTLPSRSMESSRMDKDTSVEDIVSEQHIFSEPWEDSDVVLVVENQKFHVHRMMLSMASPVFKAMLSSNVKEKDDAAIELPDKKASEMLNLLKQIYPQEQGDITFDNVEHIAKLADEYQARGVLLLCEKFLLAESKSKKTRIMKSLQLAQQYKMTRVRARCYGELRGMKFGEMQELDGFKDLDEHSLCQLLVPRIRKLETLVEDIYPQFMGAIDFAMFLYQKSQRPMKRCPLHYDKFKSVTSMQQRLKECAVCKEMLKTMATGVVIYEDEDKDYDDYYDDYSSIKYPDYSKCHKTFDKNLVPVIQEMITALNITHEDACSHTTV